MLVLQRCLAASALLGFAYAQSSTAAASSSASGPVVSVLAIGAAGDQKNLYASVVGEDATATTLLIGCDPNPDDTVCNLFSGFKVTSGPSTFAAGYEYNGGTMTIGCNIEASTTGTCSQTLIGPSDEVNPYGPDKGTASATGTGLTTKATTTTLASSDITYYPVTITAGKLSGGGAAGSASSTTESGGSSGATSSQTSAGASTTGGSGSQGSAVATPSGSSGAEALLAKASSVVAGFIALAVIVL